MKTMNLTCVGRISSTVRQKKQDEREKERQKKRAGICQMLVSGYPGHKRRHRESNRGNTGAISCPANKIWIQMKLFFPCKSFFHLHRMCLCLRIHYVMYWCLQFIVCKINNISESSGLYWRTPGSLTKGNILRENTGLSDPVTISLR